VWGALLDSGIRNRDGVDQGAGIRMQWLIADAITVADLHYPPRYMTITR